MWAEKLENKETCALLYVWSKISTESQTNFDHEGELTNSRNSGSYAKRSPNLKI